MHMQDLCMCVCLYVYAAYVCVYMLYVSVCVCVYMYMHVPPVLFAVEDLKPSLARIGSGASTGPEGSLGNTDQSVLSQENKWTKTKR